MIPIYLNRKLFDRHIEKSINKILNLIQGVDKNKLEDIDKNCLEYIETNLEKILRADTNELKYYIDYFKTKFPNSIGELTIKKEKRNSFYKLLIDDVFGKEYKNWGTRIKEYNAYEFVSSLDIKTCPYCNRNFTYVVNEEERKLRPEIDHFHPKSIYPFLAMSFYNLIPSCSTCNHTKKDKDSYELGLLNPYEIDIQNFDLTFIPNKVNFSNLKDKKYDFDSFEIKFISKNKNIEVFKLEELYKQHKDVVLEVLIKKMYYPKTYVEELSSFGFSEEEIYRYLFSNYKKEEDLHKRPLSKLIKDISEELELI